MKKFLVFVIIVGVGGYFAWTRHWFGLGVDSADAAADNGPDEAAASEEDGIGDDLSLDGGGEDGVDDGEAPESDELDAQLAQRLEKADAAWQKVVDAGQDPAGHQQAPSLLAAYTAALRATYNKPALKELQQRLVEERLSPLGERIFFTGVVHEDPDHPYFLHHSVAPGETPGRIGRGYGISEEYVMLLNGIDDPTRLQVGERLKVVRTKEQGFSIHVDKSGYYLDLYICDLFARRYPVGIGAPETPTPTGKAQIDTRAWHPKWTMPDGRVVPYGHPDNILGPIWLRLRPDQIQQAGIGIHGYDGDPEQAVRVKASNGCVRMRNEDAIQLYRVLTRVHYDSQDPDQLLQRSPMWVTIVD